MQASDNSLDELDRQRADLRRRGRLHWVHWIVLGGSVLITFVAWHLSDSLIEERDRQRSEREAGRVIELVRERLGHYEDALLSGVASIRASRGEVSHAQWRRYADSLQLAARYPGISGIGVIFHLREDEVEAFLARARQERPNFRIHPEHGFDFRLPITYIEPEGNNAAAIGLDVAFESNRRAAALEARGSGMTRISGPIVLVQDAGKTPGFLFYAPYYDTPDGRIPTGDVTPRDRESAFRGLVYAPLVVRSLIAGTLDSDSRDVRFSIRDGDELLYADDEVLETAEPYTFTSSRTVELYGRTWTFDFRVTAAAVAESGPNLSTVVLLSGLAIEAMLLGLFFSMSHSIRRALALAERTTGELASHARALSASNEELSNYAHIVSHDLKSPIRGIQDVTQFLREDLESYLASNEADPEITLHLDRLDQQASKGQALVQGILDYSSVGVHENERSTVDVGALISEIGATLGARPDQLLVDDDLPTFETHAVRLGQVLENLIGNAFKYHQNREHAVVRVSFERDGSRYRFAVSDDGPGIEREYHQRIFEAFEKLEVGGDVNSSGIGLSIVKKSVELLGGRVEVDSEIGRGTTILFDWPTETTARAA